MALKKDSLKDQLIAKAYEAAKQAYSPYSNIHVGAALITRHGEIFTGCNIENASYGLTMCAERTAVFNAYSQTKKSRAELIQAIAVVRLDETPISPCGACRQVMLEFCPEADLYYFKARSKLKQVKVKDLIPDGFRLPIATNFFAAENNH